MTQTLFASAPIFNGGTPSPKRAPSFKEQSPEAAARNKERATARARQAVYDIAACSGFEYFVTLTLDERKIDRYDEREISRALKIWLSNLVQRYDAAYVLVAERHKKGGYHFHALLKGNIKILDSGHKRRTKQGTKTVYNLPQWQYGFSTAVKIDGSYEAVCKYLCKYLCKDGAKFCGRYYLSGGKLSRPETVFFDVSADDLAQAREVSVLPNGITLFVP